MDTVILTLHIILAVFLIGVILLQRSEGGALGIGGGGGGGLMGGRSAASALTRTTVILAVGFFATSFGLGFLSEPSSSRNTGSVVETPEEDDSGTPVPSAPADEGGESSGADEGDSSETDARPEPPSSSETEPDETPSPPEPQ